MRCRAVAGSETKREFQDSEISARKRKSAVACGQLRQPAEMQRMPALVNVGFLDVQQTSVFYQATNAA